MLTHTFHLFRKNYMPYQGVAHIFPIIDFAYAKKALHYS